MAKRLINGRKEGVERAWKGRGKGIRRLLKLRKGYKKTPNLWPRFGVRVNKMSL